MSNEKISPVDLFEKLKTSSKDAFEIIDMFCNIVGTENNPEGLSKEQVLGFVDFAAKNIMMDYNYVHDTEMGVNEPMRVLTAYNNMQKIILLHQDPKAGEAYIEKWEDTHKFLTQQATILNKNLDLNIT